MSVVDEFLTDQSVSMDPQIASPWASPSQRATQRRNKRDALLVTAARLFKQQGFASASLDQMAVQLGITKPTLYYYVRSKSELIQACAMHGWSMAHSAVQAALQSQPSLPLAAALQAYAQVLHTDFGWCMVRVSECAQPAAMDKAVRQQRKALEQALQEVAVTVPLPAALMMRALEGVVLASAKSQWQRLVDAWVACGALAAAQAPVQRVPPAAQSLALCADIPAVAVQAAVSAPERSVPTQPSRSASAGASTCDQPSEASAMPASVPLQNQVLKSNAANAQKLTKQSVKMAHPSPASREQISLF